MKISRMARLPLRSRLTSRLLLSWVSQCHFKLRSSLRFGNPLYQLSKATNSGSKPRSARPAATCLKMIVLAQTILSLVVQPKITWQPTVTIRPDQRDQVDALHHRRCLPDQCRVTSAICEAYGLSNVLSSITSTPPTHVSTNGSTSCHSVSLSGGNRFSRRV